MLSELEIAAWGCWLDTIDLEDTGSDYKTEDIIMFTAFYIKMTLNDEVYLNDVFQSFFS